MLGISDGDTTAPAELVGAIQTAYSVMRDQEASTLVESDALRDEVVRMAVVRIEFLRN
jgi:hypothetical protein